MCGEFGYAAAYVHLFYVLSCVESYVDKTVDIALHTRLQVECNNQRNSTTAFHFRL
jgi:hypothetical protein